MKDGGVVVPEKEAALEEGAMDAVLVNTHQVSFIILLIYHLYD